MRLFLFVRRFAENLMQLFRDVASARLGAVSGSPGRARVMTRTQTPISIRISPQAALAQILQEVANDPSVIHADTNYID